MDSGARDAKQALVYLVDRFGRDLVNDPARLRGLLRDLAGNERLEISLLVAAAESGVAADIEANAGSASIPGRTEQLARRLEQDRGISQENARWAVGAWVDALSTPSTPTESPATIAPPVATVLPTTAPPSSERPLDGPTNGRSDAADVVWGADDDEMESTDALITPPFPASERSGPDAGSSSIPPETSLPPPAEVVATSLPPVRPDAVGVAPTSLPPGDEVDEEVSPVSAPSQGGASVEPSVASTAPPRSRRRGVILVLAATVVAVIVGSVALAMTADDGTDDPLIVTPESPDAALLMPNVVGDAEEDAMAELSALGLVPSSTPQETDEAEPGTVIRQVPKADQELQEGAAVRIVVAASLTPVRAPALPQPQATTTAVTLDWTLAKKGSDVKFFRVYRNGEKIGTTDANDTRYIDQSVSGPNKYAYWVVAVGTNGTQERSTRRLVSVPAPPTTPTPTDSPSGPSTSSPPPTDPPTNDFCYWFPNDPECR